MKTKTRIAIIILSLYALTPSFGQTPDKYVQVGDTTINLADVDLEKGLVVEGKQFTRNTGAKKIMNYYTKFKVFTSPNRDNYSIVIDTIKWFEGSRYGDQRTALQYYNEKEEMLFEKHFTALSLFISYISSSGEVVIVSLASEDYEGYNFYKSNGELIKKYSGDNRDPFIGPQHHHFFVRNNDEDKGPNTYDLIDKSGNIEEVVFPDGFLRGISFSPRENYYIVRIGSDRLLYSISNQLIWSIPKKNMGSINITWDEKKYMTRNYNNHAIEVKDLLSHELIYSIDSVEFGNEQLPIYSWNIIDSCFYAFAKKDSLRVYNFYNADGTIIQTETVPVIKRVKPYKVIKRGGEFIIKPRKLNR